MEITRRRLAICIEVLKSLDEQGFISDSDRARKDAKNLVDYLDPHVQDDDWVCSYDTHYSQSKPCECTLENLNRRI